QRRVVPHLERQPHNLKRMHRDCATEGEQARRERSRKTRLELAREVAQALRQNEQCGERLLLRGRERPHGGKRLRQGRVLGGHWSVLRWRACRSAAACRPSSSVVTSSSAAERPRSWRMRSRVWPRNEQQTTASRSVTSGVRLQATRTSSAC